MKPERLIALIVTGVLAWGVFHAIGAYRFNHNAARFWFVLAVVCAFLLCWLALLAARRSRLKREGDGQRSPPRER